ncbi:hypothetical protein PAAG_11682 [Paracoccidioides lutzii Pb01]|uniref:Cx9C motif-containing protein 4, mitochondrial n=1 Tax=Paracoccidioides lutzii (strain ATCC MYA-826 / Pb01) TaxID=502779 RepID=A0A0A2V236_PARBA|nr:hypothetical protein PAAG_11682 [Paracoccidioides lutzii Pb01]KGQ01558.1 hypothetical protein PAAG_11682 [Paracoccidioides lutzii Pb01]
MDPLPFEYQICANAERTPIKKDAYWGPQTNECAIQGCLSKNSYKEEKCQNQIDALYQCCKAFYEARGENARTPSCPKPDLLKLKMKQRAEEKRGRVGSNQNMYGDCRIHSKTLVSTQEDLKGPEQTSSELLTGVRLIRDSNERLYDIC